MIHDYAMSNATDITSSIMRSVVEANNFELGWGLVNFMAQDQFGGHSRENTTVHIGNFLAKFDTLNFNRVSNDDIRLKYFTFSLKDKARDWLLNEESKFASAFLQVTLQS